MPGSGEDEIGDTHTCPGPGAAAGASGAGAELRVEDARQRLVFHLDQVERLLGDLLADGSHAGHRVADVAHPVAAEDVPVVQVQPDQAGVILAGDHRFDARQGARLADIDALDQRMRVGAALDAGIQQPGAELQVVGKQGRAEHFLARIDARHAVADRVRVFSSVIVFISHGALRSDRQRRCWRAAAS